MRSLPPKWAAAVLVMVAATAIPLVVHTPKAGAVNGFPDAGEVPVGIAGAGAAGYYVVGSAGDVATFGDAAFDGGTDDATPPAPIVGMAADPGGPAGGYWLAGANGSVFNSATVGWYGSLRGTALARPVVGMAATPDGRGYWLVASDGGVFAFGDAPFLGSMGGTPLDRAVVGMAATPDGRGYWLVASDGGVFAFGDAPFLGSMGGRLLARPVVGMASTPDGRGYWLVGSDGGVFAFGEAAFAGSMGGRLLAGPVVGMASTPDGGGYRLVASDGGVFNFGDAQALPYEGRVLSRLEQGAGDLSLSRDCGFSRDLPDGRSLWVFCDTNELAGSWGGLLGFVLGSTAAVDVDPVRGQAPTTMVDLTGPGGVVADFLPPAVDPGCAGSPRAWPTGLADVPFTDEVVITYSLPCFNGPNQIVSGDWGIILFDWATGTWSADRSGPLWTVHGSGCTTSSDPAPWLTAQSPVFDASGDLFVFGNDCDYPVNSPLQFGNGLYAGMVPLGKPLTSASSFEWWAGQSTGDGAVDRWTSDPTQAQPLPGTDGLSIEQISVDDFGSVRGDGGNRYVSADQTFYGGPYVVLESDNLVDWTAVETGTLTGCDNGSTPCRALTVHPEYSTPSRLAISWYASDDNHVRMTTIPY